MANSSWPTPTRWRDDGARGSPSLIWITTNCRGPWGEFSEDSWGRELSRDSGGAFFANASNGKAINGPSFMFWRSFGVKVNSFGTMNAFGCFALARAHVHVRVSVSLGLRGWRTREKFQSSTVRPTVDAAIIFPSDPLIILRDCSFWRPSTHRVRTYGQASFFSCCGWRRWTWNLIFFNYKIYG